MMKSHMITGGGGIRLHVVEKGSVKKGSRLVIIYSISHILVIFPSLLAESATHPASASVWFVDFMVAAVYSLRDWWRSEKASLN